MKTRLAYLASVVVSVVAALLVLPALNVQQEVKPPSSRDQKALVADLLAIDAYTKDARSQIDALLAPFVDLPAPTGSARKSLGKLIEKTWGKQRELPTQKGQHWYFEDEKRGRFFLAGQLRKPKALLVGLHGGGAGSADASGSFATYQAAASKRKWASIYPQALEATEHGWTDSGTEEWIMRLIDEARRTFDVPPERIYIGGHSMGGYGTWTLGAHHADLFAAGVASAGAPTPVRNKPGGKIIAVEEGVIPSLRNLPLCVYQSTDDPRVPPDVNQAAARFVDEAKSKYGGFEDFTYWEVDGRGHDLPEGGADALLDRIEAFERDPHPKRVVWQPVLDWRTSFYWLDWPSPTRNAIVDATVDRDQGQIDVVVRKGKADGLAVLLCQDLIDMDRELVITLNGKETFRGVPQTSWATFVRTSLMQDPGRLYDARLPVTAAGD